MTLEPTPPVDAQKAIHLFLAAIPAGLGVIFLLPGSTFETAQSWALMGSYMNENYWAIVFGIVSCVGFIGVQAGSRLVKWPSLFLLSGFHGGLAGASLFSNWHGGGSWLFTCVALLGYYLLWRQYLVWKHRFSSR